MYKQRVMLSAIAVFFAVLILTILYFELFRRR
jgi:vesicle transport through interaction with t-SNAREs 1